MIGGEPVLGVVAEGEGAVIGEVAVGVIARRNGADRGVLIGGIAGVVYGARRCRRIVPPAVVAHGLTDALVGSVVGVGKRDAARRRSRERGRRIPANIDGPIKLIVAVGRGIGHRRARRWRYRDGNCGAIVDHARHTPSQIVAVPHGGRCRAGRRACGR